MTKPEEKIKKLYGWSIDYYTRRGTYGCTARGVLRAENPEEALDLLWKKKGSDYTCSPRVWELEEKEDFIEL